MTARQAGRSLRARRHHVLARPWLAGDARGRTAPPRAAPAGVAQHPSHPAARGRSSAPAGAWDPWARMRSRPCVLRCALEGTQSPAQWRAGGGCSLHAPRGRRDGRQSCATRAGGERAGGEWRPRPRTSTCRANPRGPQRERAARRRADAAPRLWCVSKPRVCSPPGSLTHRASHRPPVDSGSLPLWGLQAPPPRTSASDSRALPQGRLGGQGLLRVGQGVRRVSAKGWWGHQAATEGSARAAHGGLDGGSGWAADASPPYGTCREREPSMAVTTPV